MGRNRVLSFISQFSAPHKDSRSPTPPSPPPNGVALHNPRSKPDPNGDLSNTPTPPLVPQRDPLPDTATPSPVSPATPDEHATPSPPADLNNSDSSSPSRRQRRSSRPLSMVQTYQPPFMDVNEETLPELQPIFNFLNSHSNKLYQEGYFLKLDDQDIKGKPNPDRTWTECFAQLVGTVLSLWDAAELDAAGEEGEVLPKFINLTDASIKMIESLPTRSQDEQPLQNILSISTAGRNRYLLHFNSHHSLVQWTSGIRLAMFEHSTLQEAYSGALIAGKGKTLNNINIIMERARLPIQEWVRVRFGAGVPWRRCWCVIDPPNEKEYQKAQKDLKKRSPYDRSHPPILKGEIRFYDTKKDAEKKKKHSRPIASITDAYSAYAIYPQSKALIDGSTLLKVEGNITIHSDPPSATEGFVFIMPEVPPAVSGFEMLLRFLFPTWDTFGLYGRPGRLVASVLDPRSLMFAMPKHKRYGYLEILDVSGLISTDGSSTWSEREWRKKLKELTGQRMAAVEDGGRTHSRSASRSSKRLSFGPQPTAPARPRVNFADDSESVRSGRSMIPAKPGPRTDSAPPDPYREYSPATMGTHNRHSRNISDTQIASALNPHGLEGPGPGQPPMRSVERGRAFASDLASTPERVSSEDELPQPSIPGQHLHEMQRMQTPEPVNAPPAFAHGAGSRPQQQPYHSPEMRRANSRLSSTTLSQLAKAGGLTRDTYPDDQMDRQFGDNGPNSTPGQAGPRGQPVQPQASANPIGMNANFNGSREALTSPTNPNPMRSSPRLPPHMGHPQSATSSPVSGNPQFPGPQGSSSAFRPGPNMAPPPPPHGRGTPPLSARGPGPNYRTGPPHEYSQEARGPPTGGRRTPPPQGPQHLPHSPGGSPPIHRKPLPDRTASLAQQQHDGSVSPVSVHSAGSRRPQQGNMQNSPRTSDDYPVPEGLPNYIFRQNSGRSAASSRYDAASTASPDYASTRKSTDTQESVDRPRAGVLKTTGSESAAAGPRYGSEFNIPEINFGPTLNYSKVPPSGNPLKPNESGQPTPSQHPYSPSGRKSPGPGPVLSHFRQDSEDTIRRSVAWQPGTAAGPLSGDNVVSPEQFVQQRAANPPYSHQRNPSSNTLTEFRSGTPTSPQKRPGTSHGISHSRHNSADLLQGGRPASQGTMAALSGGEISSYLSAREQEHVARMTGTPLIALTGNKNQGQPSAGLVGTIQARERERAQMRQGIGGQAVAQAIDQRQREQNQQAQRAAQAAFAQQQAHFSTQPGYPGAQGMMGPGMPGMATRSMSPGPGMMNTGMGSPRVSPGFQPGPGYGSSAVPRPQMMSPQGSYNNGSPTGQQGFAQGGGWNNQNMPQQHRPPPLQQTPSGYGMGMGSGQPQSPGFQQQLPPQGGQFMPGPGAPARPGTPGRMQYQGQAF